MKFAICNETFGDWPLDRALAFAAEAGYTGWEIAPFMLGPDIYELSGTQRAEYRGAVVGAGLEVVGLHWLLAKTEGYHLTSPDARVRKQTAEYLGELARLCHDLGGSVMVLGSPQQRQVADTLTMDEAYMHAANVLRAVVKTLEETGVKLALEPLGPAETNFMNTAADARRLQEMVGSDAIGLHLDMKAMSSEAEPMPELIRANRDWLLHVHANDANGRGPGMGEVPVAPVLETLQEIGYDGWISVEVFDHEPGVERLVNESIDNLRSAVSA
ncbi:sugar phosphate isomerase/epimerase family protein [Candidatus Laterigemmans baculatus]|uniref:sugar phosphate isomerase/epimerase family protein n=1 Tax=Candidatus Laterigemmans baculatus TaxID=2770505 RepID=UPI0013DA5F83|nr:sugar phosphate isomerase/epimerase family protein [Candidatus Laterigemmans baculatus]